MAKFNSKFVFALSLCAVVSLVFLTDVRSALAQSSGAGWTAPATGASPSGSTTPNATYITPGSGGGRAAESGRSTEIMQLATAAINANAAVEYAQICVRAYCAGCWACPLSALAAVAATQLGSASGESGVAGASMSAYDNQTGAGLAGDPMLGTDPMAQATADGSGMRLPDGTTARSVAQSMARVRAQLERSGVRTSADGKMTTPDGRQFDLSKGGDGSEKGLLDMGLLGSEASLAVAAGKKIGAKAAAKYAGMKMDGGGSGGGGGGRSPAADTRADAAWNSAWGRDPRQRPRVEAQVSGLTKKLGEDTIGVSGDNIFHMVTRRYKARDEVNQFLKD